MLLLISSAPDTQEFRTAYQLASDMNADVCLLQNAVYAASSAKSELIHTAGNIYVINDDMKLRGLKEDGVKGKIIDYSRLIDLMTEADRVVGLF